MQVESITGSDSISSLNDSQLNKVISHLQSMVGQERAAKMKSYSSTLRLPNLGQRAMVKCLMIQLTAALQLNNPDAYLNGISNKSYSKDYKRLNYKEIQGVIEALKFILRRTKPPV